MMETQTTERFLRELGDVQQRFLADLVRSSRTLGENRAEVGDVFREQLHCYRRAVDDTLRIEHELCEALRHARQENDAGPEAGLTRLAADLAESGIQFREQLWHTWFETADRIGDGSLGTFVQPLRFWATMLERREPTAATPPSAQTGTAEPAAPAGPDGDDATPRAAAGR